MVLVSDRKSGMRGVLVVDNPASGSGEGGTRMSASLTTGEVARLARTMTWKWAAVDLVHGGAKAGILGDPRAAATRLTVLGAVVVAVSTADLVARADVVGDVCLDDHPRLRTSPEELLTAPVEILVPAAREDTIDATIAAATTAQLVVEGADLRRALRPGASSTSVVSSWYPTSPPTPGGSWLRHSRGMPGTPRSRRPGVGVLDDLGEASRQHPARSPRQSACRCRSPAGGHRPRSVEGSGSHDGSRIPTAGPRSILVARCLSRRRAES